MPGNDVNDLMDICLNIAGRSGRKVKITPTMCDVCIRPSVLVEQTPCCTAGMMCNECKTIYKNNIKTCNICINNLVTVAVKGEID